MTSFALQVGDPTVSADSLLKPTDLFDPETLGEGIVPEQNPDTTYTAVLESLSNSLTTLVKIRSNIKGSGKVNKALALECLEAAPDIELTPIEYYTEVPTAQLGEPTVESITDYIKNGLKRLKEWLIKIFDTVWDFFDRSFDYMEKVYRLYTSETSTKRMAGIKWPNELTDSQRDSIAKLIDTDFFIQSLTNVKIEKADRNNKVGVVAQFWNSTGKKMALNDFRSRESVYLPKVISVLKSRVASDIIDLIKDEDTLVNTLIQDKQEGTNSLGSLLLSSEISSELFKYNSDNTNIQPLAKNPEGLVKDLQSYAANRIYDSKKSRGNLKELVSLVYDFCKAIKKNKPNATKVYNEIIRRNPSDASDEYQVSVTNSINELNRVLMLLLEIQQNVAWYLRSISEVDEVVFKVASIFNNGQRNNSMESLSLTQVGYNLSMAMESIEHSLEANEIALDDPQFRQSTSSTSNSSTTQKIVEWFKYVGKLISKLINSAVEWFDEATANMVPRITKMILKFDTIGYKSSWEKLEKEAVSLGRFNKAYASMAIVRSHREQFMKQDSALRGYAYDIIDGKFKVADAIINTERLIPGIERTIRSLVDVSDKLKHNSNADDVIRELAENVDHSGFSEMYVGFMSNISALNEGVNGHTDPIIPAEGQKFFTRAKDLFRNYQTLEQRLKKIDQISNKLAYVLKDNKMTRLLRIIEKNVSGGLDELVNSYTGRINTDAPNVEGLDPRMAAYKNLATGIKKSIGAVRAMLNLINNYVYTAYMTVGAFNKIIKAATAGLIGQALNAVEDANNAANAYSYASLESVMTEIEREVAIEAYMDQGEDSYQQNMSEGQASSGGESETSYLNQSGGDNASGAEEEDGGFEGVMESLENSLNLFTKIKSAGRVDRYLALEAYETNPTVLGNPKNYSNTNPDKEVVPIALESLSEDIKDKLARVWEWIKQKLNQVSAHISKIVTKANGLLSKYQESSIVSTLEAYVKAGGVITNDVMSGDNTAFFDESSQKIRALQKDRNFNGILKDTIESKSSKAISVFLSRVDKVSRFESEFEKIGKLFTASDSEINKAATTAISQGTAELVGLKDTLSEVGQILNELADNSAGGVDSNAAENFIINYPRFRTQGSNKELIAMVVKRINLLADLLPAATTESGRNKNSALMRAFDNIGDDDRESKEAFNALYAVPRVYNHVMASIVAVILLLQKLVKGIVLFDELAVKLVKQNPVNNQ